MKQSQAKKNKVVEVNGKVYTAHNPMGSDEEKLARDNRERQGRRGKAYPFYANTGGRRRNAKARN